MREAMAMRARPRRHGHPPPAAAEAGVPGRGRRRGGAADRAGAAGLAGRARRRVPDRAAGGVPPGLRQPRPARRGGGGRCRGAPRAAAAGRPRRRGSTTSATRSCCRRRSISPRAATSPGRSATTSPGSSRRSRPGTWAGPIESGFGLHLVLVRERVEGALPDLAGSVRPSSASSWPTGASASSQRCTSGCSRSTRS